MATGEAWLRRLPHALSFARVLLVVATYPVAFQGDKPLFAVLVLLAVLTDVLDGPIARATGSESRFGANVDSAADLLFYLSLPAWAYIFQPGLVLDNLSLVLSFAALYVLANVSSHMTFGALGVHNRLSRASGTMGVVFTFSAILWGILPLFKWALLLLLVADLAQRFGALGAYWMRRRPSTGDR